MIEEYMKLTKRELAEKLVAMNEILEILDSPQEEPHRVFAGDRWLPTGDISFIVGSHF
jgi:hypothetical protein